MPDRKGSPGSQPWVESFEVVGKQAKETLEKLLNDKTVRKIVVKNSEGKELINIPLSAGVVAGGVAVVVAPALTALAGIGALFAHLTFEIEHDSEPKESDEGGSVIRPDDE